MKKVLFLLFLVSVAYVCHAQTLQVANDSIKVYSNENMFQQDFEIIFFYRDDKKVRDGGYVVFVQWTGGVSRINVSTTSKNKKAYRRFGMHTQGVAKNLRDYFRRYCREGEDVELRPI